MEDFNSIKEISMIIDVNIENEEYKINIGSGLLDSIADEINLNRKVLIVTDSGVPVQYANKVKLASKEGVIVTIEAGEDSKSLESFTRLQKAMLENGFSRHDCVVAVGGGVVGDLAGFAAACYMRGIDFYNIPTTVLAQVDSSIGGKTAVNFNGVKNIVGAFYQPKKVVIDTNVSTTLSDRLIANGLAEAVKMACTSNATLFEKIENGYSKEDLYDVVPSAIMIKKYVVEEDVKEAGLRKVLNFGHTIGHGIEVASDGNLLHGESVGLGMLLMCADSVRDRLTKVMNNLGLPTTASFDMDRAIDAISHDKKSKSGSISTVYVNKVGEFEFRDMTMDEIAGVLRANYN